MKLRKLWPALGLMCMGLCGAANAHPYSNNSQSDSMSSHNGSQDTTKDGTYQRGTYREITPNAGPRVSHGADVFITADFIWWKAVQEGTDYATTGIGFGAANNTAVNIARGQNQDVARDWAPGFKVGLGLNLCHDGWDIYAQYTWLRPSNSNSLTLTQNATTGSRVTPLQEVFAVTQAFNRASASWSLHFNVIDLELGRSFYLSQFLTMRPFIGLKGTWQDQNLRIRYFADSAGISIGSGGNPDGPYKIRYKNDMWGLGVRGGFNISWYMSKNWSIFGDLAYTALWTDYTTLERKDTVDDPSVVRDGTPIVQQFTKDDNHYSVKWVTEVELGLRWETWFYDDSYHFAVQAGWEEQVWINWNSFMNQNLATTWEDMNFHGLNLKFRFDF